MSDITFTRGYGFPKGSTMDYSGYHGYLVNNRHFRAGPAQRIPYAPEPSVFDKIPALDGFSDYGTEYVFRQQQQQQQLGRFGEGGTLPTLDTITNEWVYPDGTRQPATGNTSPPAQNNMLGVGLVLFGLWALFGR